MESLQRRRRPETADPRPPPWSGLVLGLKLIPPKILFRFCFRIDINWTDDLSHSCPHRYLTQIFAFHFRFRFRNSEGNLFGSHIVLRSQGPPTEGQNWKNWENDIFGVKKCLLGGPPWNHLNGLFGAFNSHPQKRLFLTPKMS